MGWGHRARRRAFRVCPRQRARRASGHHGGLLPDPRNTLRWCPTCSRSPPHPTGRRAVVGASPVAPNISGSRLPASPRWPRPWASQPGQPAACLGYRSRRAHGRTMHGLPIGLGLARRDVVSVVWLGRQAWGRAPGAPLAPRAPFSAGRGRRRDVQTDQATAAELMGRKIGGRTLHRQAPPG